MQVLTDAEKAWVDAYHAQVWEKVSLRHSWSSLCNFRSYGQIYLHDWRSGAMLSRVRECMTVRKQAACSAGTSEMEHSGCA